VRPDQKRRVVEYSDGRGVSINQAIRDLIDFGAAHGFFVPLNPIGGKFPPLSNE
jgi:hypothetical protein